MSYRIDVSNPEKLSDEDRKYLADRGLTPEAYAAQQQARDALRNAVVGVARRRQPRPVVEEVDEPYSQWAADELKSELRNRNLSVEGRKADWVARLEADDEAQP